MPSNINHKSITELARELRKNPTPSEKLLWEHLRKRQFLGLRFLRQFPIIHEETIDHKFFYIADFYCSEKKLIIEVDGPIHQSRIPYDRNRDSVLSSLGFQVIRIQNHELEDIDTVLSNIESII